MHCDGAAATRSAFAGTPPSSANGCSCRRRSPSAPPTRHLRSIDVNATVHQARHWFGSSVYERTRDLRLTQELMGHLHPQSTAGYTRIIPSRDGADVVRGLSAQPAVSCH